MDQTANALAQNAPVRYGGVEAGGTKFVCAIGNASLALLERVEFPTAAPAETLDRAIEFFRSRTENGALTALGVGSFGPVDPRPDSPTWGHITTTPKAGWRHTDFAGRLGRALGAPVGFDTDTNAAALGEGALGAAKGLHTFVYLTIGTGVGGGALVGGERIHGLLHPEMGHMKLPRAEGDDFEGACPFHGDCLEGMISGPALHARAGGPPEPSAPRPRNMDPCDALSLRRAGKHYVRPFPATHYPRRRRHASAPFVSAHPAPRATHPGQLPAKPGNHRSAGNVHRASGALGDNAGVVGSLALARLAAEKNIDRYSEREQKHSAERTI